eukprot:gene19011-20923_t
MATLSSLNNLRGSFGGIRRVVSSIYKCNTCTNLLQRRGISIISLRSSTQKFTKDHEWIRTDNGIGTIGITAYAQDKLGDVVYVELPDIDLELEQGDNFGSLESVKAVSDLYAPVSGTVTGANENLVEQPDLVNTSPYDEGWIIKMKLSDPNQLDDLMSEEDYDKFVKEEEE